MKVDFHLHSSLSDGAFSPEILAGKVVDAGIRFAALTDHDDSSGNRRFMEVFARHGGTALTGIELSSLFRDRGIHILGYGLDPDDTWIRSLFSRVPSAREAIAHIHSAGGIAFLAHPLEIWPDPEELNEALAELKKAGLDGIEALYKPYTPEQQASLLDLADRHGLKVCAGSDYHGPNLPGSPDPGIEIESSRWKAFRNALPIFHVEEDAMPAPPPSAHPRTPHHHAGVPLPILLPAVVAIMLFLSVIFGIVIPSFEENLLNRKREMIRELTNSAWSILSEYNRAAEQGLLSETEARNAARSQVRALRYGPEAKDYFWITDTVPRMIMHPYRSDLDGQDLSNFSDPNGVRLFVEFVRAVEHDDHGYVGYVWQWKDDPERIVPKESYVRIFRPWGWIIGTGLYLEDVRTEIQVITNRIILISLSVVAVMAGLLAYMVLQNLKAEEKRRLAEEGLRDSHDRYRTLVETATEGTLLILNGRCAFANPTFLRMTGYSPSEFTLLDLDDFFPNSAGLFAGETTKNRSALEQAPAEETGGIETTLMRKDGTSLEVVLASHSVDIAGSPGRIVIIKDLRQARNNDRNAILNQLQASLLFLNEPLETVMQPLHTCPMDCPAEKAARIMVREKATILGVTGTDGEVAGVITDRDFRERIVAEQASADQPIFQVMSAPVISIPSTALVFEAALFMQEKNVRHLVVRNLEGQCIGIVRNTEFISFPQHSFSILLQKIRRACSIDEIARTRARLPLILKTMIESGVTSRNATHMASALADAITKRIITLTLTDLGDPPVPFAFMTSGSEGREEQTLVTDQDNALVYEDPGLEQQDSAKEYFLQLGKRVCRDLGAAGYAFCKGEYMACNPQWNQPLTAWKNHFQSWIEEPDTEELLRFNIFFDFRCVFGETSLVRSLRRHIHGTLADHPAFFFHLARNALSHKVPISAFGKIITETVHGREEVFNAKEAVLPLVNFARLYALQHGINKTNTADRLRALWEAGVLQRSSFNELLQAYNILMLLRYKRQSSAIAEDLPPDNDISLRNLTEIEKSGLKQAFSQVTTILKKIAFDFPGAEGL